MRPFPSLQFGTCLIPEQVTYDWFKMVLQLDPDNDEAEQQIRMELERQMTAEVERALHQHLNALLPPTATDEQVRAAQALVEQTSGPVRDALRRNLERGADLGVSVAFDQFARLGMAFDWTLVHTEAARWASQYSYELIQGMNATTRAQLQIAIDEWFRNADSLGALRRQLEPTFGARRAQTIAQTETTRAAAEGTRRSYEQSGVVQEMEWRGANDERQCVICGPRVGRRAPLNHPMVDGVTIPAHTNCRCWWVAVIEEPRPRPAGLGPRG